ncbi:MAG: hypothetical protein ABIO60_12830 [Aquaticitalea sp.]
MNLLEKATNAIFFFAIIMSSNHMISQTKYRKSLEPTIVLQETSVFNLNQVQFQEWYAGIKVGGTGINVFFPNITNDDTVVFEAVYFHNLSGKITKGKGQYSAVLKNNTPFYTWEYPVKPADYPFDLKPNECVISYKEKGQLKYLKIANLDEKAGTYYENGPPSIYQSEPASIMATVDED